MIAWRRVCIVGVGLLGGSIGQALRTRQLAREVVGVGRDPTKLTHAIQLGAIDAGWTSLEEGANGADLVVVCTPVQQIADSLWAALSVGAKDLCLTDVGSTKESIVNAFEQKSNVANLPSSGSRFVGSHPLAGSEKSGVDYASPDLFEKRVTIITPSSSSNGYVKDRIKEFWNSLGSTTIEMSPAEHDTSLAITSHLPHLLASALAGMTPQKLLDLTAGGWRDSTRIAAGNPEMWRQIIQENRAPVLRALQNFATIWQQWIDAVESPDPSQLELLLLAGKKIRDAVGNRHLSG